MLGSSSSVSLVPFFFVCVVVVALHRSFRPMHVHRRKPIRSVTIFLATWHKSHRRHHYLCRVCRTPIRPMKIQPTSGANSSSEQHTPLECELARKQARRTVVTRFHSACTSRNTDIGSHGYAPFRCACLNRTDGSVHDCLGVV